MWMADDDVSPPSLSDDEASVANDEVELRVVSLLSAEWVTTGREPAVPL